MLIVGGDLGGRVEALGLLDLVDVDGVDELGLGCGHVET